uniref:Putative reverse transcriptase domain-containing protein n=1 Tax=Tanacetum cinerariifolium TaxID=118510 RepID=A0A6L2JMA2_TANCI|nr:putative reverse transcriptase domain-containing protein [Tanacetum cinerariifolium]
MHQRRCIELFSDYNCEVHYHPRKANVVANAFSKKERVKPRRVRPMSMTIRSSVMDNILATQVETSKVGNATTEMLRDLDQKLGKEGRWRKPLEFEVGDRVILKVSPWKDVIRFRKKGMLAQRYIGPFEILKRIGPVAYRLRFPKELSSVHDTSHVSNLKKCLVDANLHVPLDEISIEKTLCFVEEPVEIMDREVRSLTRSKIPIIKGCWNSKCGLEFTWERDDHMKAKFPPLFADCAIEPTS